MHNHPLKGKFSELLNEDSIEDSDWRFVPEFHADLSRYKEMQVHCTCYKNATFHRILHPFGLGRQNFNTRFYVGLHTPVNFFIRIR